MPRISCTAQLRTGELSYNVNIHCAMALVTSLELLVTEGALESPRRKGCLGSNSLDTSETQLLLATDMRYACQRSMDGSSLSRSSTWLLHGAFWTLQWGKASPGASRLWLHFLSCSMTSPSLEMFGPGEAMSKAF